jgi:hypothetical protein
MTHMQMKLKILFITFMVATAIQCATKLHADDSNLQSTRVASNSGVTQDRERVPQLIAALGSETEQDVNAQNDLLNLARSSPENRKVVIDELILRTKEQLQNRQSNQQQVFRFWLSANQVFQKLHATEAIPLLISFISYGDGYAGNGLNHRPAQDSLFIMGPDAIPSLSEALSNSPEPLTRMLVADCLGNIGGSEAQVALNRAKEHETNGDVIRYIDASLATIAREAARDK